MRSIFQKNFGLRCARIFVCVLCSLTVHCLGAVSESSADANAQGVFKKVGNALMRCADSVCKKVGTCGKEICYFGSQSVVVTRQGTLSFVDRVKKSGSGSWSWLKKKGRGLKKRALDPKAYYTQKGWVKKQQERQGKKEESDADLAYYREQYINEAKAQQCGYKKKWASEWQELDKNQQAGWVKNFLSIFNQDMPARGGKMAQFLEKVLAEYRNEEKKDFEALCALEAELNITGQKGGLEERLQTQMGRADVSFGKETFQQVLASTQQRKQSDDRAKTVQVTAVTDKASSALKSWKESVQTLMHMQAKKAFLNEQGYTEADDF